MPNPSEQSNVPHFEQDFQSKKETAETVKISPEAHPATPETTEVEKLVELRSSADEAIAVFELEQTEATSRALRAAKDLEFSDSEIGTRMEEWGTASALTSINSRARTALRGLKRALVIGLGALALGSAPETTIASGAFGKAHNESTQGTATESSPKSEMQLSGNARPEIRKDNPQRQGYANYEAFKKYVEAMRDLKAEEASAQEQEKWRKAADENLKHAGIAEANKWEKLKVDWIKLAAQARQFVDEEMRKDPKAKYESARALSEEEFKYQAEAINKAFKSADEQREWVAGVVHSKAYQEKARKFEELSPEEIQRRKDIAQNSDVSIDDPFHTLDHEKAVGVYTLENSKKRFGEKPGSYVVSRYDQSSERPVAVHELQHATTDGDIRMSDYAQKLYFDSYSGPDASTERGKYTSDPTELDARKRVFEFDLEKNGVWKYGQTFTDAHTQKALELQKAGKLSVGSTEFLKFIKKEKIPLIMNTIAENKKIGAAGDTARNA